MRETNKRELPRIVAGHFAAYLHGNGIDIGSGDSPLRVFDGTVRPWDVADGDAEVLAGVADASFNFVYSSHCLEHVHDIGRAMRNWTRVLKPRGFLYVVVPDYELYEKCTWPSRFNGDHKHSFSTRVSRSMVDRENHWHVEFDLCSVLQLLGVDLVEYSVECDGYDWNKGDADQTLGDAVAQICVIGRKR